MADDDVEPIGPKGRCPGVPGACEGDESNAFVLYSDGHGFCHAGSCPKKFWSAKDLEERGFDLEGMDIAPSSPRPTNRKAKDVDLQELLDRGEPLALPKWKVQQETAAKWDYRVFKNDKGEGIHVAIYHDEDGRPVDAKVRNSGKDGTGKDFYWAASTKEKPLYGLHRLPPSGKKVVVVEGEKDALNMSQLLTAYPVVSVPNGAGPQTKKDLARYVDRLSKFDEVVLCFDPDEAGRKATEDCARLFQPGKVSIARLPSGMDVTELVQAGRAKEVTGAVFHPEAFRPDGIVSGKEVMGRALEKTPWGIRLGIDFLDQLQWGWRDEEIWVNGAGIGMGKSDLMYQVAAFISKVGNEPIACFNYEASTEETFSGLAGKNAAKRFDVPEPEDGSPNLYYTDEERFAAFHALAHDYGQVFINDDNGAVSWDAVKERIRYLVHAEGVKRAFIDPMAALVANEADKNTALERMMAEAKALCKELKIGLWFNSHLARPGNGEKPHEEGGRVKQSHFRGSAAITMWASVVIGMERNQQAEDPEVAGMTILRALKVRKNGKAAGRTACFYWNEMTGIVEPKSSPLDDPEDNAPETIPAYEGEIPQ